MIAPLYSESISSRVSAARSSSRDSNTCFLELVSRFFAYYDNYENNYENYTGNVTKYIDDYVEEQNKKAEENENIIIECQKTFANMLSYAEKILGKRGFRKSLTSKSTPRARFEALSLGIAVALKENPNLPIREVKGWIDSEEFAKCTRSDAANNKTKLVGRINFVRDKLLSGE